MSSDEIKTLQGIIEIATKRIIELQTKSEAKGSQSKLAGNPVADSIKALRWEPYKHGSGTWAFGKTKEGGLTPDAVPLLDAIHSANGKLVLAGELFTVSDDGRFIGRKKAK